MPADAYYYDAINALAAAGVFAGTGCDEGFCPDPPLTRWEMAVWLIRPWMRPTRLVNNTLGDSSGNLDPQAVWMAVTRMTNVRSQLSAINQFRYSFGGYCSEADVWEMFRPTT